MACTVINSIKFAYYISVEEFAVLEDSSLHRCSHPNSQEPRFKMTSSDYQTLTYYLNTVTTIDTINDNLLSR